MATTAQGGRGLNVIALVSGGKDSFFSLLHCRANGHRIVALANLHPPPPSFPSSPAAAHAGRGPCQGGTPGDEDERDLNSFMYQTVGHEVVALYAEATAIPLYRRAITGHAAQHAREYAADAEDETESMVPLLQAVKAAHPEADAVCAGAVLSTYQRTRVESVATRLGLTPLAYLWKFPVLPAPRPLDLAAAAGSNDAQLLDDMAAVGLEARIIKVASGGLDESFLWTNVATAEGKARLARAMRRFGPAETGALVGEGGEFETLVLGGPPSLFRKRIVVAEEDRRVVREGGGSAWLRLRNPRLEDNVNDGGGGDAGGEDGEGLVRIPGLLDPKFTGVLDALSLGESEKPRSPNVQPSPDEAEDRPPQLGTLQMSTGEKLQHWCFISGNSSTSIEDETRSIVEQIRERLRQHSLPSSAILCAAVVLRRMADFPAVNSVYGTLVDAPNPPSRVTVSCGDAAHAGIAVHLTVHTALGPGQRQGLHVQSRSYWAPANIGPYSQAISVPVASLAGPGQGGDNSSDASCAASSSFSSCSGPRLVSVAGQIPLVPATMALPAAAAEGDESTRLQLALALQHLWRIGLDTGVQWWTSAVAFFPRSSDDDDDGHHDHQRMMSLRAKLAARAWEAAHGANNNNNNYYYYQAHTTTSGGGGNSMEREEEDNDDDESEDEDDDGTGPDLWDRTFDRRHAPFSSSSSSAEVGKGAAAQASLPDWSVVVAVCPPPAKRGRNRRRKTAKAAAAAAAAAGVVVVPPLFVAEVEQLPRGAGVEWHAHWGVAHAGEGGVAVLRSGGGCGGGGDDDDQEVGVPVAVSQVVVRSATTSGQEGAAGTSFVQTVVAERYSPDARGWSGAQHGRAARAALGRLGEVGAAVGEEEPAVVVRYVDVGMLGAGGEGFGPVVPCWSLWDDKGERLAAVTVYRSVFDGGK